MPAATVLALNVSANSTPTTYTTCQRSQSALTIGAVGTTAGAWSATVNVWQWVAGGLGGPLRRIIATFSLSQVSPSSAIDLLTPATNLSADITFSANPSNDTVTVVVEG